MKQSRNYKRESLFVYTLEGKGEAASLVVLLEEITRKLSELTLGGREVRRRLPSRLEKEEAFCHLLSKEN
jgi:hypothetical protein